MNLWFSWSFCPGQVHLWPVGHVFGLTSSLFGPPPLKMIPCWKFSSLPLVPVSPASHLSPVYFVEPLASSSKLERRTNSTLFKILFHFPGSVLLLCSPLSTDSSQYSSPSPVNKPMSMLFTFGMRVQSCSSGYLSLQKLLNTPL